MDSPSQPLVLVVEDDPAIAELMCDVLQEEGYRCLTAADAERALHVLETHAPALMTLDLGLPGVRGGALLHRIRANPLIRDVPVIIVSAERVIETQLRAASQAVLAKPFNLDQLVVTVQRVLAMGGAGGQAREVGGAGAALGASD